jgi:hypothetical protein
MTSTVTIATIERTTAVVGVFAALMLYAFGPPAIALGCVVGSAFMIANFFLLALVGGGIIALARGGGVSILGILLVPIKLAFFIGASYIIVVRLHVSVPGFVTGVLTQFVAILIEIWRAAPRTRIGIGTGTQENKI